MRRAHGGPFFGLFLIPTPVFGVPLGWVGGMGQFGTIYPHGLAPFRLGIWTSPFLSRIDPHFAQFDTFQGYKVHQFLPLVSSDLFCYLLWS